MKTQKTGGKYDFARRAFRSVDDLAYYLGRSPSYVQTRLTGGGEFTEREGDAINKAVRFYDRTDIEPVQFQKLAKRTKEPELQFIFSMVWPMIAGGFNMVDSIKQARDIAGALFFDVPTADEIIETIYKLTEV